VYAEGGDIVINTKIEWADHTFNPWEGCTKVSPGCAHCYAAARNKRFAGGANWGKGAPRRRTSEANWKQPLKWDEAPSRRAAIGRLLGEGQSFAEEPRPPRVFCASLADWLDDEVPIEWLADLLALIRKTPHLDWLLLTKRPQNWRPRIAAAADYHHDYGDRNVGAWLWDWFKHGIAPANVWIGTTVEDQQRADERIPQLLQIPARVRFLSGEPLLGPVEFSNVTHRSDCVAALGKPALAGIHWVIAGGESGPGARPMHPAWARSLRDQCAGAGVAFHFKQWGEWEPGIVADIPGSRETVLMKPDSRVMVRVGKKAAGRLLDGLEHNAAPSPEVCA